MSKKFKKVGFLLIIVFYAVGWASNSSAETIKDLFDALKQQPQYKIDMSVQEITELSKQSVTDKFYPKVGLFGTFEHYNSATNLRPVPPTEVASLTKHRDPLPFAKTIERMGVQFSMPVFVKELFSASKKLKALSKSTKVKKQLTYIQNEALVLTLDANLLYLSHLENAMKARKNSLLKTLEDVKLKVKVGRAPESSLDKIEDAINSLEIALNDIEIKKNLIFSNIESLTGIELSAPIEINMKSNIQEGEIFPLKPLELSVEAKEAEVQENYDKLFPKVYLTATYSKNYAQDDVMFSEDVDRDYGRYMISVNIPLFEKTTYTNIKKSKIILNKERYKLRKTKIELTAEAKAMKKQLVLLDKSIVSSKKSIDSKKNLLEIAKVSFNEGRMIEEEYLRYEDNLLNAQAKLYEIVSKKWQTIAKLAVIYGNDLIGVVK